MSLGNAYKRGKVTTSIFTMSSLLVFKKEKYTYR